jgi:hypothetical protein
MVGMVLALPLHRCDSRISGEGVAVEFYPGDWKFSEGVSAAAADADSPSLGMSRFSLGESPTTKNSNADAGDTRRCAMQKLDAGFARRLGESLTRTVVDWVVPDGLVGVKRRFGQVERMGRMNV